MMGEWMDGAGIYIGGGYVYGPCMHVRMNASLVDVCIVHGCMDDR